MNVGRTYIAPSYHTAIDLLAQIFTGYANNSRCTQPASPEPKSRRDRPPKTYGPGLAGAYRTKLEPQPRPAIQKQNSVCACLHHSLASATVPGTLTRIVAALPPSATPVHALSLAAAAELHRKRKAHPGGPFCECPQFICCEYPQHALI